MNKLKVINFNAIDDDLSKATSSGARNEVDPTPEISIKDNTYKISDLAKLDAKKNLGLKLLKPRNPEAKRGSYFEILLINKTTLVVRREWVKRSQLLVIMPEKLIYKIFDEQTGDCLYDPDKDFMDNLTLSELINDFDDDGVYTGNWDEELKNYKIVNPDATDEMLEEYIANHKPKMYGERRNETTIDKFFKNLNHSGVAEDISNSDLLFGVNMFTSSGKYNYEINRYEYHWKYNGLPFKISTLEQRKMVAIYYKSPQILNNEVSYMLNQTYGFDTIKTSLTLLKDFKASTAMVRYINALERVQQLRTWWPDENVVKDINVLRTILNLCVQMFGSEYRYNAEDDIKCAVYFHVWQIKPRDWTDWYEYIRDNEFTTVSQSHYIDILNKAKALNNGKIKTKFPTHWLTYERKIDRLYDKHRNYLRLKREFTYSDMIESLEHVTAKDNKDYDYQITLPRTYGDLVEEGEKMNHCVGGYVDGVYNGARVVMFLRQKSRPNKSFGTVEVLWTDKDDIKTYYIAQCKGNSNSNLPIEAIDYVEKYLNIKKMDKHVGEYYVRNAIENGQLAEWREKQRLLKLEAKNNNNNRTELQN